MYKKKHKAGIHAAAVEDALKTWRNSTKRTPNDFTVPGISKFTVRAEERTTHPHPPSGGISFVFSVLAVMLEGVWWETSNKIYLKTWQKNVITHRLWPISSTYTIENIIVSNRYNRFFNHSLYSTLSQVKKLFFQHYIWCDLIENTQYVILFYLLYLLFTTLSK